jgi:superfamily II RNA helicase
MTSTDTEVPTGLARLIPRATVEDPDTILDLFLQWTSSIGFELYPAQEEALLELMAGHHVVLSTPTGSGKSLVALGLHFKALCERRVSYYTSPIKALASEKFFSLCQDLGADNVGMLTGDASINPDASVICCTAEVLANLALRLGDRLDASYVVMDEFHYYSDVDRGVAWQIPLITLPTTRFLLMSATLGDMSAIVKDLEDKTGIKVAEVSSAQRPVPLDFEYRDSPIHETVGTLVESGRAPMYIVNFTQRECAELAQSLTSMQLASKEERARIRERLADRRFTTPYGREFKRFLSFGIGVHHAGLLPKYRLAVEQLAQQGILKVVSGTDTLGVGVNIPIRTVLFTKLAKYDGHRVSLLKVRDFKQISGRAGRKGFDDQGWVVCQAPEHVIDNALAKRKAASGTQKKRKMTMKSAPKGEVSWSEETFQKLISKPPERLQSRFRITHGMILDLLQRDADINDPGTGNFNALRRLIADCHEDPGSKAKHLQHAARLALSLYRAGIVHLARDTASSYLWVVVNEQLQVDFSLFHNLSLFLVEAIKGLDEQSPDYPLDLVSLCEAVLEDPIVILRRQEDRAKTELLAQLKAEGVPYEERVARLDEVTYPKPCSELIHAVFDRFRRDHPWVGAEAIQPKSIGREMLEHYLGFGEFVRRYGLARSEGVLLRYLSQLYKTLDQNVPDWAKTESVHDVIAFFRAMLERIDTSLIDEWEGLRHPELTLLAVEDARSAQRRRALEELCGNPRALASRVRADLHQLVQALARREWEDAVDCIRFDPEDPSTHWEPSQIEEALAPFFARFPDLVFDHRARLADKTQITKLADKQWKVIQTLVDPEDENLWYLEGRIDLRDASVMEGPIVVLTTVGC